VLVRRTPAGWLFLMLRAYRNWDFPKGLVEPGEDPLDTARREVAEETSIDRLRFSWGNAYQETERYAGNKIARYYVAETDIEVVTLPVSAELGRPEHDEWCWLTYEDARRRASVRLHPVLSWAARIVGLEQS
jgi:8-oxo-dGTP pyrophosphatase MutT (NUDIX family)